MAFGTSMCLTLRAAKPCKRAVLPFCRTLGITFEARTRGQYKRKSPARGLFHLYMAESEGFEPSMGF